MISREEARLILQNMFNSCIDGYTNLLAEDKEVPTMLIDDINALDMAIEALSNERPKGRWEEIRNAYGEIEGWICTCGREVKCKDNFCPNCGCEMRGEEE